MLDTLEVLDASGHLTLTWDPSDEEQVAKAREEVETLKKAGYSFFAVVGSQGSDEIEAGNGTLLVERIADPIRPSPTPRPSRLAEEPPCLDVALPPKKPKGGSGGRRVVAVRPMAGG